MNSSSLDITFAARQRETLTSSRMGTLLTCPRKHFYRYELGLFPLKSGAALRFGSAFHKSMEQRWKRAPYEEALKAALETAEFFEEIDAAMLAGLLSGYYARYAGEAECIASIEPETEFRYPLKGSLTFDACGMIDGLGVLKDGRLVLLEHKTAGEDISDGAEYWIRLRFNAQVFQYLTAARVLGWEIGTVIYDVTRKPAIRQKQGESAEQFGLRLAEDCKARPEFYFARKQVPVLEDDLAQFEAQRLNVARMILYFRTSAKRQRLPEWGWPRNCNGMTCRSCEFESFCMQNLHVTAEQPPAGFMAGAVNPELTIA